MARVLVRDTNGNSLGIFDLGDELDGRISGWDMSVRRAQNDPDLVVITVLLDEGEE